MLLFIGGKARGLILLSFHKNRFKLSPGESLFFLKISLLILLETLLKYKGRKVQAAVLCARHTNQDSFVLFHLVTKDKRSLQGLGGVD